MAQTPDHPTTVSSGTLIMGTYEIERLINSGGMGEVYRGRNIHNGEPVAIKIVLPSLAHDPKIVALFQKESTVLSRLSHEAIVRYHVFTVDPTIGRPCMVMEFVSGTAMSDRIDQGPMPVEDVKVMLRRVASGLDKAHRAGVVHRDLSPDNVILEEGMVEHAKLIDFGIAKSTALGAGTLLQGQFAGKFNWVSPEQLGAYGGVVDGRSDIYSLGLITAAASRGSVLQMGASIVDAVGSRSKVPDLTGVDAGLVPLLSWMLNPDPAQRPESMAQVMAAVDNPNLVPEVQPEQPPKVDPNRTIIGGTLPIPEPIAPAVSVAPVARQVSEVPVVPAVSIAPVTAAATAVPLGPTVIAPVTAAPAAAAEPEDASPFGAPGTKSAAVMAAVAAPEPARRGKGGMVAVLALLALGGGGAGAYYAGMFDQKATPVGGETQEQADARVKADQAAADKKAADEAAKQAEAQKAAEADAAKKAAAEAEAAKQAEAEKAAQQAEADAAAKKAAEDEAARKQAEAEAEAKKLAEAEAAKKAEADAAAKKQAEADTAKKAEEEAAALKAAEAAKQAEADAAAKKAADEAAKKAEADAAALKAAEAAKQAEADAKKAAEKAAKQAEAEAAAQKAAEEAAKQAEAAAKKAADEAAAKKAEEEAAAKKLAEDEAAKKAAAEAAAKADPVAAQLVYLTDYHAPLCTMVRMKEPKDSGFVLDGFTADSAALASLAEGWKAATNTTPEVLTHQVNISQCAVLDFANKFPAPDIDPLAISSNAGEVVKSGSNVEGKVEGLNGRNLTFLLFSEGGGATNLKPWTSVNADGSVSFAFNLTLEPGQPSAPQILVALATDQPLTSMDKLRDGTAAQALMPFLEKQLSTQGIKPTLGFGFFRLEN